MILRGKVILFATFCLLFWWRWTSLDSPLPESWTADSRVRYTARILEKPEQTDSKTIIRQGKWKVVLRGYQPLAVGERYAFVGKVEPTVLLGKQTGIEMVEPTFERVGVSHDSTIRAGEKVMMLLADWRERMVDNFAKWLPEPHASLAAGILLGVKRNMPWEFYQQLVATGTLHIVAASGYNTMIVARVVMGMLLIVLSRGVAIGAGVGAIAAYVILAGGSAAVVRAGIMGSLTLAAYYWGRPAEAKRLLWVTAGVMLLVQPLMLLDVGFQLSVAATVGLLYLEPVVRGKFQSPNTNNQTNSNHQNSNVQNWIQGYLGEYLWPTVAATLATMPIIYFTFGRVSWLSPFVNMLVLPLTPLIMFLSAVVIGVGSLIPGLGQAVAWVLYVPLWVMVSVIRLFG